MILYIIETKYCNYYSCFKHQHLRNIVYYEKFNIIVKNIENEIGVYG